MPIPPYPLKSSGTSPSTRWTGEPIEDEFLDHITSLRTVRPEVKIIAGSGITPDSIGRLGPHFDGFIVGTHFQKVDPATGMKMIVPERVREMKDLIRKGV